MPRRPPATPNRILIAQLHGTARNRLEAKVDRDQAIADLRAITTRVDLLSHAAGAELGGWQHSSVTYRLGREIALLLVYAGADVDQVKTIAAETVQHLGGSRLGRGIGESRRPSA